MAVIWNHDVISSSYDVMKSRGDVSLAQTTENVSYVISSFQQNLQSLLSYDRLVHTVTTTRCSLTVLHLVIINLTFYFLRSRGGYLKYPVALGITKYLKNEDEYVPWAALDNNIKFVSRILPQSSPAFKYLKVRLTNFFCFLFLKKPQG